MTQRMGKYNLFELSKNFDMASTGGTLIPYFEILLYDRINCLGREMNKETKWHLNRSYV